jgi:hypothetical protein
MGVPSHILIRTDTQRVRNTQTILPETHATYPCGYVSEPWFFDTNPDTR